MKRYWSQWIKRVSFYKDDLKWLALVGIPSGILCLILAGCLNYTKLF